MSLKIDLTKPLTAYERQYLIDRNRWEDLATADALGDMELPPANPFNATDPTPDLPQPSAEPEDTEEEEIPYDEMTVADLKAELDARAHDAGTKEESESLAYAGSDKKADLIAKLEKHDEAYPPAE